MGSRYDCDGALGRCLLDAGHIKPCFAPGPGQIPAGMPAAGGFFSWCPNCHQYWDNITDRPRTVLCSYGCREQDQRARSTLTLLSRVAFWMSLEGFARRAESPDADLAGMTIGVLRHIVFVGALDGAHGEMLRLGWASDWGRS